MINSQREIKTSTMVIAVHQQRGCAYACGTHSSAHGECAGTGSTASTDHCDEASVREQPLTTIGQPTGKPQIAFWQTHHMLGSDINSAAPQRLIRLLWGRMRDENLFAARKPGSYRCVEHVATHDDQRRTQP
jgi:hypothetical protein